MGRGSRKMHSDEFVYVCVGKVDDVMESEMDVSVTPMGVTGN